MYFLRNGQVDAPNDMPESARSSSNAGESSDDAEKRKASASPVEASLPPQVAALLTLSENSSASSPDQRQATQQEAISGSSSTHTSARGHGHGVMGTPLPVPLDLTAEARIKLLETALFDKEELINQLNETSSAYKLLNEKQQAEINTKEILLIRKSQHVDELNQQLRDLEIQLVRKDKALAAVNSQLACCQQELTQHQQNLAKEDQNLQFLRQTIHKQQEKHNLLLQQLDESKEREKTSQKEIDRHLTVIRRLDKKIEELTPPEKADANLSPRSFHENQLIALRDDTITAKTKEIWLLMGQNDTLRGQLDATEQELHQLQQQLVQKESDLVRKDKRIAKLDHQLEANDVLIKQREGQDKALEIAMSQNTKLLQTLQIQETQTQEFQQRIEELEQELRVLRSLHQQHLESNAVNEVEVLHKTKLAEDKALALANIQNKLHCERQQLHQEIADTRAKYLLDTEQMQSELVLRRNKQYEVTLKLQDTQAALHASQHQAESALEQLAACKSRMQELERIVNDALEYKHKLEITVENRNQEIQQLTQQLQESQNSCARTAKRLEDEIHLLNDRILGQQDQTKQKQHVLDEMRRQHDLKDRLIHEQKERLVRLVEQVNGESQKRAQSDLQLMQLHQQTINLQSQMECLVRECQAQALTSQERLKVQANRYEQLESEYTKEQIGKSRLVYKYVDALQLFLTAASAAVASCATPPTPTPTPAVSSACAGIKCLDLSNCWLADHEVMPLFALFETVESSNLLPKKIDLRGNRLTEQAMKSLVGVYQRQRLIADIDLRNNFICIEGIRLVAKSLEALRCFERIQVKQNGRIEAYKSDRVEPVVVIDITSNLDASLLLAQMKKGPQQQQQPRTKKKSEQILPGSTASSAASPVATATPTYREAKPTEREEALREIYGVDLVNQFMPDKSFSSSTGSERKKAEKTRGSATSNDSSGSPYSNSMANTPIPSSSSSSGGLLPMTTPPHLTPPLGASSSTGTIVASPTLQQSARMIASPSLPKIN